MISTRQHPVVIAVAGLLLAPALFGVVEGTCWRARASYGLYQANAGSALCFGVVAQSGSGSGKLVVAR